MELLLEQETFQKQKRTIGIAPFSAFSNGIIYGDQLFNLGP